jgi:hypothetical protein
VLACTPHPGLGTVVYRHVATNLATCARRPAPPSPRPSDGVTVRATRGSQALLFKGRVVLTIHERYGKDTPEGVPGPLWPFGTSPDGRWVLYTIDPFGSASIPADGLQLKAIRVTGGRSYALPLGLLYDDYRAWCGNRLVMTAGGDRIAVHGKRLIVTGPPGWKPHRVVADPRMSFGSLVCDGDGIVVQGQPSSTDANFFHTHWSLYRVGLDGSMSRLTSPPARYADESPKVARGVVYFVRSTHGNGKLYALQNGKVIGPLLSLGYSLGYYGHQAWPYSVTR